MISYAQNFEDVILARAFLGKTDGFYVDIGAMDPEFHSVTKHFYDLGWRGVNVEPGLRFHQKLCRERPRDINLCVAVGTERGQKPFHDSEIHGISTFRSHLAAHFSRLSVPFETRAVEMIPLRELCDRHCVTTIDFMKIDVEGMEKEVLESGDWSTFRPRIVLVEAITPDTFAPAWADWEHLLLGNGYLFAYFDGLNRFYVRREDESLREHFRLPPNVLDRFETHEVARLRRMQMPSNVSESPVSSRMSLWILVQRWNKTEWHKVSDISFVPNVVLRVLNRCVRLLRRWTGALLANLRRRS